MIVECCTGYISRTAKITKGKIYECILDYKEWYVIIDDIGLPEVYLKQYFTIIKDDTK